MTISAYYATSIFNTLFIFDLKAKDQVCFPEDIEPLGATSGDYYLSEAAKVSTLHLYFKHIQAQLKYLLE